MTNRTRKRAADGKFDNERGEADPRPLTEDIGAGGQGASPDGCAVCGQGKGHGSRYAPSIGFHTYVEPTDELRLSRMKARRAAASPPPTQDEVIAHAKARYVSDCADTPEFDAARAWEDMGGSEPSVEWSEYVMDSEDALRSEARVAVPRIP